MKDYKVGNDSFNITCYADHSVFIVEESTIYKSFCVNLATQENNYVVISTAKTKTMKLVVGEKLLTGN